ncbi:MAG: TolC family protein [Zetaproteobacteria bacterium]|nr:TolC family protein [Zetaproteobacteria bacterium]
MSLFTHQLRISSLMAVTLLMPSMANAMDSLSLQESVAYALQHNRMLAVSAAGVEQAQGQVEVANGDRLPDIDFTTGAARTDSPLSVFGSKLQQGRVTQADFIPASLNNPGFINNFQSRLGLRMPLFAGGSLRAQQQMADAQLHASEYGHLMEKQQLIYQTISAYVASKQAVEQVDARVKSVALAEKRYQDVEALKLRGMAIVSDVMDAHVHVLRSQLDLESERNSYTNQLESLALVMGYDDVLQPDVLAAPSLKFPQLALAELLSNAYQHRADYLALTHTQAYADAQRDAANSGNLPHVDLVAAQEWNQSNLGLKNRNSMVAVTVSMNIFNGGSDQARLRVAESNYNATLLKINHKRQQIEHEVRQAWRSLEIANIRLQSEKEALKQTEESLNIQSMRHAQGLEKTSDLLNAQVRLDASRVSYIRSEYDVILAQAALMLAAGTLDEGALQ